MATLVLSPIGQLNRVETSPTEGAATPQQHHLQLSTVAELLPHLYLVATINQVKNQCIVELSQPLPQGPSSNAPASLRAAFRTPRIIQVLSEDEGTISAVELLVRPQQSSGGAAGGEAHVPHVHLFIGTSNGTVLLCNALRGTVLAVAQFQYHHNFKDSHTSHSGDGERHTGGKGEGVPGLSKVNQAVVAFAVLIPGSGGYHWNPSLPANARTFASSSSGGEGLCVLVIHDGGKVVRLGCDVLEVLVQTSVNRMDGKRPLFVVEWPPKRSGGAGSCFPVVGPSAHFAPLVEFIYTLPPQSDYSALEKNARLVSSDSGESVQRVVYSAAAFYCCTEANHAGVLLQRGSEVIEKLLLCGSGPAYSIYTLDRKQFSNFSATAAVRAVTSLVKGVARSLWSRTIRGSGSDDAAEEPSKHLPKKPQRMSTAFLEHDSRFTRVQVDSAHQWGAFYCEGPGRLYIVQLSTGLVCHVIKGCRLAQFQWWNTNIGGRRALLLAVHEPLRHAVQVYSTRLSQRVAACHVPDGSVLLRAAAAATAAPHSASSPDVAHVAPVLLTPSRALIRVHLEDGDLEADVRRCVVAYAHSAGVGSGCTEGTAVPRAHLKACRTPSDFVALGEKLLPCSSPIDTDLDDADRKLSCQQPALPTMQQLLQKARTYERQLLCIMAAAERRFGCSGGEWRLRGQPAVLSGPSIAITSPQCVRQLQLRAHVVGGYVRLLTCKGAGVSELRRLWGGASSLADMWEVPVACSGSPAASRFWSNAVTAMTRRHTGDDVSTLKHVLTEWQAVSPPPTARTGRPPRGGSHISRAAGRCPDVATLLSWFSRVSATSAPHFARPKLTPAQCCPYREDIYSGFAEAMYGGRGLVAFSAQLPTISSLGLDAVDLACITLTWLCRTNLDSDDTDEEGGATMVVGLLCFVLEAITDEIFADALERVCVPLCTGTAIAAKELAAVSGSLLLCGAARHAGKPTSADRATRARLLTIEQRLLRLRALAVKLQSANAKGDCAETTQDYTPIVGIRLGCLLAVHQANHEESSAALVGRADTLEGYLARHGVALHLVQVVAQSLPRPDNHGDISAIDMMGIHAMIQMCVGGEEAGFTCTATAVSDGRAPWTTADGDWNSEVFESLILSPLSRRFIDAAGASSTAASQGSSLLQWRLFGNALTTAVALNILQEVLRPLTEKQYPFWSGNTAPEVGFVSTGSTCDSSVLTISGSRPSREYLRSVTSLAQLSVRMLKGVSVTEDGQHTRFTHAVVACLKADASAVFAVIPANLRTRLHGFLRVLDASPHTPLRRTRAVVSLARMLLFCLEASTITVEESAIAPVSAVVVPWSILYGDPATSLQLLPPAEAVSTPNTEEMDRSRSYRSMCAGAAVVRQFVSKCVLPDARADGVCGVDDADLGRLISDDTTRLVEKMASLLYLGEVLPGTANIVIADYAMKALCSTEQLQVVLARRRVSRELVAEIALANLRALLNIAIEYLEKEEAKANSHGGESDPRQISAHLDTIRTLLSEEGRRWLNEFAPIDVTAIDDDSELADRSRRPSVVSPSEVVLGRYWVSPAEFSIMKELVLRTLQLPVADPRRRDFGELLFLIARTVTEGRAVLPVALRTVVAQLPTIADTLKHCL